MKKTLLATLDFYPKIGGVANYYFNLCRNLPADKIVVLTTKEEEVGEDQSFKIYRENLLVKRFFVWPKWLPIISEIWKIAKQEKAEIIWAGDILPTGTAAGLVSRILGIPYIVSCHGKDLLLADGHRRKSWLSRFVLRRAYFVMANSQYTKEIIRSFGVKEEKIKVVYPGVNFDSQQISGKDREEVIKKYQLEGKRILLSVGRLVERKGFDKVIEAMDLVEREVPDLVYIVSGEGEDEERLLKIAAGGKGIKFIGRLSDREKDILFSIADVFIMASRSSEDDVEGFGIVYLEAAQFGKPAIAGREGGAKEAVVDGETGILVDPINKHEIAGAIIKLFKDNNLRLAMGARAKERVAKDFQWARIIRQLEEILN